MINRILLIALVFLVKWTVAQQARPNIIFILSDDHTSQAISAYGSKLTETPNIDRIAKEGALFRNNFITNSICGPSRACFLTGRYSHLNGYKLNEKTFDPNQPVFPEKLQAAGYQTAWIGKVHLKPMANGFNYWKVLDSQGDYYNPDFITKDSGRSTAHGYVTDLITEFSLQWLSKRDKQAPFFLVVGEKATHREWLPSLEDLGSFDDKTFPIPENFYDDYSGREAAAKQDMSIDKTMVLKSDLKIHVDYTTMRDYKRMDSAQRKIFAGYYEGKVSREFDSLKLSGRALVEWKYQRYLRDYLATAKSMDRNIGRILQWVDQQGLTNNTIVIYASDQGFYLGEHGWFDKRFMYEESLRTPFVMRYPGHIRPGTVVNGFTLGIDWGPTLLEMAGLARDTGMQGRSFYPLVKQDAKKSTWREAIYYHYYEFPEPHHVYPHFGIRTSRYKLMRFYGGINTWELYDLQQDPQEMKNIYNDPAQSKNIIRLKEQLRREIDHYRDTEAAAILQQ
ncbi:sulfatase family protein [Flavihumibacter petaseus]|uniref:Putative sulfatase n=1 Tax=Flavihumibacter petaseus NBRC 106054 TaxID=1220578 RepID=A0A0E9N1I7_9BACT|nr:sulfatase [Flavihumibacter petaseus]GAO43491.1 putative sulfatase [Flavihumibacter petaseus NBRC 106054]